jgi:hypothetical protein
MNQLETTIGLIYNIEHIIYKLYGYNWKIIPINLRSNIVICFFFNKSFKIPYNITTN